MANVSTLLCPLVCQCTWQKLNCFDTAKPGKKHETLSLGLLVKFHNVSNLVSCFCFLFARLSWLQAPNNELLPFGWSNSMSALLLTRLGPLLTVPHRVTAPSARKSTGVVLDVVVPLSVQGIELTACGPIAHQEPARFLWCWTNT